MGGWGSKGQDACVGTYKIKGAAIKGMKQTVVEGMWIPCFKRLLGSSFFPLPRSALRFNDQAQCCTSHSFTT
ncbi:hypothetical protein Y1Q_0002826 [Alligator mississippiensis]|uniref:Uncharacterized protein n=1 Tax=Alligator mississippiensis TaxID=8496 RepID=A0A151NZ87_ALLMI|nr:hypothetical protein Y1Q_0002826 [Alligator mississippiensis]